MSQEILRAKVIAILDSQRIVINAGLEQGVSPKDHFYIYEMGEEIADPETKQGLGRLEMVKAHLEAFVVQEKMSVLIPVPITGSAIQSVLSATLAQVRSSASPEPMRDRGQLNVRQDQIRGIRQTSSIVIGDMVRSVHPLPK